VRPGHGAALSAGDRKGRDSRTRLCVGAGQATRGNGDSHQFSVTGHWPTIRRFRTAATVRKLRRGNRRSRRLLRDVLVEAGMAREQRMQAVRLAARRDRD
jgi:hypothetical protein